MDRIFAQLITELEKPRALTAQSLRYLAATYGVERDNTAAFLENRLAGLEDDEIDLTLSSLFTPKLADQAVFAAVLEEEALPVTELPMLVQRLLERPTIGCIRSENGVEHRFPLRQVTIERFVLRLRLEGSVSPAVLRTLRKTRPASDHPLMLAIARRACWDTGGRRELLNHFLLVRNAPDPDRTADLESLLQLVEAAQPTDIDDALARIPAWEQSARDQLNAASLPRPFFNQQVEDMHGGRRDRRGFNQAMITRQQSELAFLSRLKSNLEASV